MHKYICSILILLCSFCGLTTAGQQLFTVRIVLPDSVDLQKIKISYENGVKIIPVPAIKTNEVSITDSFFSKHVAILINYKEKSANESYQEGFFLSGKTAEILFRPTNSLNPLSNYKTRNATNFSKMGEDKYRSFISKEENDIKDFYARNASQMDTSNSLVETYFTKQKQLMDKKIEFVKNNGNLYYSFWLFRTYFVLMPGVEPGSMLRILNYAFPNSFRKLPEAQRVKGYLLNKMAAKKNHLAPDFVATDITGKKLSLSQFKGKYILLDFWASWCVPCVKELPIIKDIRDKYPEDILEIISVSSDTDSAAFLNSLEKYGMTWHQMYGNWGFKKFYVSALPETYLIDKNGMVIYSRTEENDYKELHVLRSLLETIK